MHLNYYFADGSWPLYKLLLYKYKTTFFDLSAGAHGCSLWCVFSKYMFSNWGFKFIYLASGTKRCQDLFRGRPRSICAVVGRQDFQEVLAQLMGPYFPWIFAPMGKRLEFTSELDRRPVISQTMQNQILDIMILWVVIFKPESKTKLCNSLSNSPFQK